MILKRFYDEKLAQASYLIGCPTSGEAIVVDPNRDVETYVAAAENERLQIKFVTETHIHADYLSGARELAIRTGAKLLLSDEGDTDWKYEYAAADGAQLIRDGDSFHVGAVRFDVIKTPGHTPEHISFVITDEASGSEPQGVLTGDFVFVGDVGRPDLLERAAKVEGTMEVGARSLYHSLQSFRSRLPDFVMLWPGHGSGSACGKSLGGVPVTTLGYEKAVNWALRPISEEAFVSEVLSGQPDPPKYFAEMKRRNKSGPPILGAVRSLEEAEDSNTLRQAIESGHCVIDVRQDADCEKGHFLGTVRIPPGKSFTNWAGWLVPYDMPILLLASNPLDAQASARDLRMIGLDDVRYWVSADAAHRSGMAIHRIPAIEMKAAMEAHLPILDVRSTSEFDEGHIPGATHVPLGHLPERIAELTEETYAVHCHGGYRSSVAVSILANAGIEAKDIIDGFEAYEAAGLPIERTAEPLQV